MIGHKVPWEIGILICHPVTSKAARFPAGRSSLSPCIFATAHLTACVLNLCLPLTSQPMKWRTPSQRPISVSFPGFIQQFARVTSIGSLPPKTSENNADPRRAPQRPRRTLGETPQSPLRGKFPRRASRRVVPLGW